MFGSNRYPSNIRSKTNDSSADRLCENSGQEFLSSHWYRRSVEKPVQLDERMTLSGVLDRSQSTGGVFKQPPEIPDVHHVYADGDPIVARRRQYAVLHNPFSGSP